MVKNANFVSDEDKIKKLFKENVRVVFEEIFQDNKIVLFELLEDLTFDDVLESYSELKATYKDFEYVDIEKEYFFCNGFWIKAKGSKVMSDFKKIFDRFSEEEDILAFPVEAVKVLSEEEIKEYLANEYTDKILKDAVKIVMHNGKASTAYIQRRFAIGYSRAARLIDMMELMGIVGNMNGEKYRKVLITPEKFKEYFGEDFV